MCPPRDAEGQESEGRGDVEGHDDRGVGEAEVREDRRGNPALGRADREMDQIEDQAGQKDAEARNDLLGEDLQGEEGALGAAASSVTIRATPARVAGTPRT